MVRDVLRAPTRRGVRMSPLDEGERMRMSDDLPYLRQAREQLRQSCDDCQRQLNALAAQVGWLADKLGQKSVGVAIQAGPPPRLEG
ncbi:hypothetical protein [Caulobacter vibrioides]|uniref:Uncharacterized protein n=2 Tax=Caulobacter vibrioides TaxID=155892 RepID=Q9A8G1_CAUVC|nr:hypothetical protein [Caulobacter vibrioides]YP_002516832.1 hypothetical protein CCNA_01459 [Caulobacter vibrioides NA1000]AAK23374.1 hypothetical protein CC_1393 [Caulobacter vibrioides CB15]ACL94924.1 hypothetical protein CCNA_01459 [Caulobacter vibrioides NA1000]ATC28204.1 hypothetical protein CA607_07380 [Caulobacter vibrioides]QXZ53469.1 hypothetical protein KZH45_07315 [Caulobacter vibrioides]